MILVFWMLSFKSLLAAGLTLGDGKSLETPYSWT